MRSTASREDNRSELIGIVRFGDYTRLRMRISRRIDVSFSRAGSNQAPPEREAIVSSLTVAIAAARTNTMLGTNARNNTIISVLFTSCSY
jgi:hypothetical protein